MLPFLRSPRNRQHLDTLNRVRAREMFVYSERDLRSALGAIRKRGFAGRVVIADDITLKSPIEIDSGFPTLEITGVGAPRVYLAGGDHHFGVANSYTTISNLTLYGATDGAYAARAITIENTAAAAGIRIIENTIYADECVYFSGLASTTYCELRSNFLRGNDAAKYLLRLQGAAVSVFGNRFLPPSGGLSALLYSAAYCALNGNSMGRGDINIDGSASTSCLWNTISNNVYCDAIEEINNGGWYNAVIGNTGDGSTPITTNLGNGQNTVVGNTGTGTITSAGSDSVANNT